jgi:glycoside/pentoside/hexuronide:cation symporter, GPH family
MVALTDSLQSPARVSTKTRIAYGLGSIAYGVKDNGFSYFLLFFYSQVLGAPASLASAVIFAALIIDAISDPIVGQVSDRLHSRWGRRHPFMYISAIPVAVSFCLLWMPPPQLSGAELIPYLLVVSIVLRLAVTLYEIPSTALVSEISSSYEERTALLSYRYFFQWSGGLLLGFVMYVLLLRPTADIPNGFFNIAGYQTYGLIGAVMILASILVSSIGTHHLIPTLNKPPPARSIQLMRMLGELGETLSNRSFLAIFAATLILGLGASMAAALNVYFNNYFWELTPKQVGLIVLAGFLSAPASVVLARWAGGIWEKKTVALCVGATAFIIAPLPIILRLLGMFPENDDPALFPLLFGIVAVDLALIITTQILLASMIADIPEDSEIKTGRRSEGTFFAAQMFARKAVSGLGVLVAGAILEFVKFPIDASIAPRPEAANELALVYVPVLLAVYVLGLLSLSFYRIRRADHLRNLETLKSRRSSQ